MFLWFPAQMPMAEEGGGLAKNSRDETAKKLQDKVEGRIIQIIESDLDRQKSDEIIILTKFKSQVTSGKIYIFDRLNDKLRRMWESERLPVWKIWVADADNEGTNDLVMALWKYEEIDGKTKNRLYIYGWNKENFYPIWRGTSLSYDYIDFVFYDIDWDGCTELISLEKNLQEKYKDKTFVVVYHWNGFGFTGEWQTEIEADLKSIHLDKNIVTIDGDGKFVLKYNPANHKYCLQ